MSFFGTMTAIRKKRMYKNEIEAKNSVRLLFHDISYNR